MDQITDYVPFGGDSIARYTYFVDDQPIPFNAAEVGIDQPSRLTTFYKFLGHVALVPQGAQQTLYVFDLGDGEGPYHATYATAIPRGTDRSFPVPPGQVLEMGVGSCWRLPLETSQ